MIDRAMDSNKLFGLVPAASDGCLMEITSCQRLSNGNYAVRCIARRRFRTTQWWEEQGTGGLIIAYTEPIEDERLTTPSEIERFAASHIELASALKLIDESASQTHTPKSGDKETADGSKSDNNSNSGGGGASKTSDGETAAAAQHRVAAFNSFCDTYVVQLIESTWKLVQEFIGCLSYHQKQSLISEHGHPPDPTVALQASTTTPVAASGGSAAAAAGTGSPDSKRDEKQSSITASSVTSPSAAVTAARLKERESRGAALSYWCCAALPFHFDTQVEMLRSRSLIDRLEVCLATLNEVVPQIKQSRARSSGARCPYSGATQSPPTTASE